MANLQLSDRLPYDEILSTIGESVPLVGVILAASFCDQVLFAALKYNMRPLSSRDEKSLFGGQGALSTFSARIRVGFAFRLLTSEVRHDLDKIRELRNAYAHQLTKRSVSDRRFEDCVLNLKATRDLDKKAGPKKLLAEATELLCLFLIMRTSPSPMRADPVLTKRLEPLGGLDALPIKLRDVVARS